MSTVTQTYIEIAKLVVSIIIPITTVGVLGYFINRRLKEIEHIQWYNRKVIEKRISLYDDLSKLLNKLYCFYTFVGYWRSITPGDVIQAKRDLDKQVNIYRYLFEDPFYNEYQKYIKLLFKEGAGAGHEIQILSLNEGKIKNEKEDFNRKEKVIAFLKEKWKEERETKSEEELNIKRKKKGETKPEEEFEKKLKKKWTDDWDSLFISNADWKKQYDSLSRKKDGKADDGEKEKKPVWDKAWKNPFENDEVDYSRWKTAIKEQYKKLMSVFQDQIIIEKSKSNP